MTLLWAQTASTTEQSYDGATKYVGSKFLLDQTIIGNSVTKVTFSLKKQGSPTGTVEVKIVTPSSSTDSDNSIATSSITTSSADYEFNFASGVTISANSYITCLVSDAGDSSNRVQCDFNQSSETNVEMWLGANYDTLQENNSCPRMAVYGSSAPSSSGTRLPPPPIVVHF